MADETVADEMREMAGEGMMVDAREYNYDIVDARAEHMDVAAIMEKMEEGQREIDATKRRCYCQELKVLVELWARVAQATKSGGDTWNGPGKEQAKKKYWKSVVLAARKMLEANYRTDSAARQWAADMLEAIRKAAAIFDFKEAERLGKLALDDGRLQEDMVVKADWVPALFGQDGTWGYRNSKGSVRWPGPRRILEKLVEVDDEQWDKLATGSNNVTKNELVAVAAQALVGEGGGRAGGRDEDTDAAAVTAEAAAGGGEKNAGVAGVATTTTNTTTSSAVATRSGSGGEDTRAETHGAPLCDDVDDDDDDELSAAGAAGPVTRQNKGKGRAQGRGVEGARQGEHTSSEEEDMTDATDTDSSTEGSTEGRTDADGTDKVESGTKGRAGNGGKGDSEEKEGGFTASDDEVMEDYESDNVNLDMLLDMGMEEVAPGVYESDCCLEVEEDVIAALKGLGAKHYLFNPDARRTWTGKLENNEAADEVVRKLKERGFIGNRKTAYKGVVQSWPGGAMQTEHEDYDEHEQGERGDVARSWTLLLGLDDVNTLVVEKANGEMEEHVYSKKKVLLVKDKSKHAGAENEEEEVWKDSPDGDTGRRMEPKSRFFVMCEAPGQPAPANAVHAVWTQAMVLACRIRELDTDADWSFFPNDINLLQQTKIIVAMKMVADVGDELVVMDIEPR
eukprot:g6512.t1